MSLNCHHCTDAATPCDHLLPCSTCISTNQHCTYSRDSARGRNISPASVQQWPEHPKLSRGSLARGRLKPLRNDKGEIDEFEWQPLVQQNQDLRIKPVSIDRLKERLAGPSIDLSGESESIDLVGDALVSSSTDRHLLSGLDSVLPPDVVAPIHPTIFLNAHLASHRPLETSRIAAEFEPSNLNRGNCLASTRFGSNHGHRTRGGGGEAVVWRVGDERYKRPTSVGWTILKDDERDQLGRQGGRVGGGGGGVVTRRIFTHHTPIHQLELMSLSRPTRSVSFLLGVRSHTSLDLLHLNLVEEEEDGQGDYRADDEEGEEETMMNRSPIVRHHVSHSIPRTSIAHFTFANRTRPGNGAVLEGEGLVVDVEGGLYGFGLDPGGGGGDLYRLRKPSHRNRRQGYSGFSRVQYSSGGGGREAIVAMEDQVLLYDLRSPTAQLELISPSDLSRNSSFGTNPDSSLVTSLLERRGDETLTRNPWVHTVCTTRDLIWVDQRMSRGGNEVMRWEHERVGIEGKGVDRTLAITELPPHPRDSIPTGEDDEVQRIALTSRLHPQVTIFTTGLNPTSAPTSLLDPYDLSRPRAHSREEESARDPRFTRVGLSFSLPRTRVTGTSEEHARAEDAEEEGIDDEGRSHEGEEDKRRRKFLEKMVKEAQAEEREREESKNQRWRVLEVGMSGELYEREVGLAQGSRDDGNEREREGTAEIARVRADRPAVSAKDFETVRLDMRAVRESIAQEAMVEITETGGERDPRGEGSVVELLKKAVEEAREIEGDVGALTPFELLHLGREHESVLPQPPLSDSEDEHGDTRMIRGQSSATIESLPRPSSFIPPRDTPLLSAGAERNSSRLESLVSSLGTSAGTILRPFDTVSTSRFNIFAPFPFSLQARISDRAKILRQTYNIPQSNSPASLACDRFATDISLSSAILLTRPIEPDEPTDTPNQPQSATEDPPLLHLSYIRPIVSDELDDSDHDDDAEGGGQPSFSYNRRHRKKKPTLNGRGTRLLLAEWHIGSDPRSYTWTNPYASEKEKDDPYSQYSQTQSQSSRKGKKGNKSRNTRGGGYDDDAGFANSSSQVPPSLSQTRFEFPSSFPSPAASRRPPPLVPTSSSSQSYFPSLGALPNLDVVMEEGTLSQDWNQAATQPVVSVSGPSSSLVEGGGGGAGGSGGGFFGGAASQVVPGAFGSRNAFGNGAVGARAKEKEKKKTKKRVSGF